MSGRMCGWTDGRNNEWIDVWLDEWTDVCMDVWMSGWMDVWMHVWTYGWTDGRMDGWMTLRLVVKSTLGCPPAGPVLHQSGQPGVCVPAVQGRGG